MSVRTAGRANRWRGVEQLGARDGCPIAAARVTRTFRTVRVNHFRSAPTSGGGFPPAAAAPRNRCCAAPSRRPSEPRQGQLGRSEVAFGDPHQRATPFLVECGHRGSIIQMGTSGLAGKQFAQHYEGRAGATARSVGCREWPTVIRSGMCFRSAMRSARCRVKKPNASDEGDGGRCQRRIQELNRTCPPGPQHEPTAPPARLGAVERRTNQRLMVLMWPVAVPVSPS